MVWVEIILGRIFGGVQGAVTRGLKCCNSALRLSLLQALSVLVMAGPVEHKLKDSHTIHN